MNEIQKLDFILSIPKNYTSTSLILPPNLSFEEWTVIGKAIQKAGNAAMWWIGDWWAYGEHKYGERAAQALESEYSFQSFMDAGWVSRRVETSRRREVLTWSHHREVAALEPQEQDDLLSRAIEEGWSRRDIRREARITKSRRQSRKEQEFPTGKYRIIYADPPWKYGNEQPAYHTEQADHYPLMTVEEIAELPIRDICQDDSVLFLWVTSPILEEAFQVINSWGFSYKTSFVWDKVKHNMGHYNSVRHELLLVSTKGSCTPDVPKLFDSVQVIERTEHSQKPEIFREIIDTIYPHGKRIELFARINSKGWDRYGNELSRL